MVLIQATNDPFELVCCEMCFQCFVDVPDVWIYVLCLCFCVDR